MPDLMAGEFQQIHEAIDAAWDLIRNMDPKEYPEVTQKKIEKVKQARELIVDLAGGNSR